MVEARILKGFRDSLPLDEIRREEMILKIKSVFSSFGYAPIDTPCLEYEDVLLSKSAGETEKQIYSFEDNGKRKVALRFDLTVPFARFVAMYAHKNIELPFKRYHIAKVWRGEKSQHGRYREFYQCDVDTVGSDSFKSDAEIIEVIISALTKLNVGSFEMHISHRGILKALLESLNLSDKQTEILRLLDKIDKIGKEGVEKELLELLGDKSAIDKLLKFASFKENGDKLSDIDFIKNSLNLENTDALLSLKNIYESLSYDAKKHIVIDFSITRGLDYYTGFVFETFLTDVKGVGSISSGGRYDNLTGLFMKEKITGVGGSIGLDRLISALDTSDSNVKGTSDLYVVPEKGISVDVEFIKRIRENGLRVDVAPSEKKNNQVYRYAEVNHIPYVLFYSEGSFMLKTITTRKEEKFTSLMDVEKRLILCEI